MVQLETSATGDNQSHVETAVKLWASHIGLKPSDLNSSAGLWTRLRLVPSVGECVILAARDHRKGIANETTILS
jgi:hypothetical protein